MTLRSRISRLLGAPAAPAGEPRVVAKLRAALDAARASLREARADGARATKRLAAAQAQRVSLEQRLQEAGGRLAAQRREIPIAGSLRAAFPRAVETLRARSRAVSAESRELAFLEQSATYRAASAPELSPRSLGAQHMMLEGGLNWWVPVKKPSAGLSEAWMAKQKFPFLGMLRTREFVAGGIMLDLGAHIGRMAIPRVILGDVQAAYCAEPDPVSYACLTANVVDNGLRGLVMPDQTAIGDRNGTVRLQRIGGFGSFHVLPVGAADEHTVEVPCTTLDTWVERLGIDLDAVTFVKVDVEGFERRLVAGARNVLSRRHIVWQMEIKPAGLRAAGDDPESLYKELTLRFTHFIDVNRAATGARIRSTTELGDALAYIEPDDKTDVLLFNQE